MSYFKPISISLSPNTEKDDIILSLKLIFSPLKWIDGEAISELENQFKNYFNVNYAFSFNSGRSSFLAILKSLELEQGTEILIQAYTCNAVVNPILWAGFKPVYVDCDENDFNIDINDLEKKINAKTKVLVVQHTFGMPANIDKILEICQKNNLILIEDCAHCLGAEYKGKKVGLFGDVSFFSLSRDKIISSIYGGLVITNNKKIADNLKKYYNNLSFPSFWWVFQQLLHPIIINWIILPIYNFINLGKIFLVFVQSVNILSKAIHNKEKKGEKPSYFPKRMPNALALLALNQFKKLERFNNHRDNLAKFYYNRLKDLKIFTLPLKFPERKNIFLRFTIKSKMAHQIIFDAWHKNNILLGDWYTAPIAPDDTNLEKMGYSLGICSNAEKLANTTFNLPTHINISLKDAERIVNFLKKYSNQNGDKRNR